MNTHNDAEIKALSADYKGGRLNRREFLARLALVTGSMAAAHLLVEQNGLAQEISKREVAGAADGTIQIKGRDISFPLGDATGSGYLASPTGDGPFPAVIVIHENRGLNEHTRDVARRFAIEGFVALAPDALARFGGTGSMKTPDEARAAIGKLSDYEMLSDLEAAILALQLEPTVTMTTTKSRASAFAGAARVRLRLRRTATKCAPPSCSMAARRPPTNWRKSKRRFWDFMAKPIRASHPPFLHLPRK